MNWVLAKRFRTFLNMHSTEHISVLGGAVNPQRIKIID